MNLAPIDMVLIAAACLSTALSHLILKYGSLQAHCGQHLTGLGATLCGIGCMGIGVIANLLLLKRLPLTIVTPMGAMVYVLVPIGANVFFREHLGLRFWTGASLLYIGIIVIGLAH